jgi:mRNA interferase MazF
MDMVDVKRFDVCLINLDPTIGSEIRKTRPCLIVSPDEMNQSTLKTVIIAPLTSTIRHNYPTRILVTFRTKQGQIALDQIRAVDRARIIKNIGKITAAECQDVLCILQEMFA